MIAGELTGGPEDCHATAAASTRLTPTPIGWGTGDAVLKGTLEGG